MVLKRQYTVASLTLSSYYSSDWALAAVIVVAIAIAIIWSF